MRKANVDVTIVMDLEKEKALIEAIVPILENLKETGKIDRAHITSHEIEEPYELEI